MKNFTQMLTVLLIMLMAACNNTSDGTGPTKTSNTKSSKGTKKTTSGNSSTNSDKTKPTFSERFRKLIKESDASAIKDLVHDGFDPNNTVAVRGSSGAIEQIPPLHCIAYEQKDCSPYNRNILKALIDNGADINKQFKLSLMFLNDTPLITAVGQGFARAVEDLLIFGADPNIVSDEGAALHLAIQKYSADARDYNDFFLIISILMNTPNINFELKDGNGHTPLYYAHFTKWGHPLGDTAESKQHMKPVVDLFKAKGIEKYE